MCIEHIVMYIALIYLYFAMNHLLMDGFWCEIMLEMKCRKLDGDTHVLEEENAQN